jgi:hypothetical protein
LNLKSPPRRSSPGDGFDLDGMHREDRRRQPRRGNPQSPQSPPQQDRRQTMQENIVDVIQPRIQPGQVIFDPERRVDQRIVLGQRKRMNPDGQQSRSGAKQRIARDVLRIVPDKSAGADDRNVNDQHQRQ